MDAKVAPQEWLTNLPREYYLSPDIYEQELRKVFNRQWMLVGHVSLIKQPGDYYVRQAGPESLIIARDEQREYVRTSMCAVTGGFAFAHRARRACDASGMSPSRLDL